MYIYISALCTAIAMKVFELAILQTVWVSLTRDELAFALPRAEGRWARLGGTTSLLTPITRCYAQVADFDMKERVLNRNNVNFRPTFLFFLICYLCHWKEYSDCIWLCQSLPLLDNRGRSSSVHSKYSRVKANNNLNQSYQTFHWHRAQEHTVHVSLTLYHTLPDSTHKCGGSVGCKQGAAPNRRPDSITEVVQYPHISRP